MNLHGDDLNFSCFWFKNTMHSGGVITRSNKTLFWFSTAVIEAEHKSKFVLIKYTTYLALTGLPWNVFCEYFGENWLHYNGTTL